MNYSTSLSASELSLIQTAASAIDTAQRAGKAIALQVSLAARALYENEIRSGLLLADVRRAAYTMWSVAIVIHMVDCELCDRVAPVLKRQAKLTGTWLIEQCVRTWLYWQADLSEHVTAAARIALHTIENPEQVAHQVYLLNRVIGRAVVSAVRSLVAVEQRAILLWAKAEQGGW